MEREKEEMNLQALIEAVEAGTLDVNDLVVFEPDEHAAAWNAYEGSLDAAKRLHDAILPARFRPSIDSILRPNGSVEWRAIIHEQGLYYPAIPQRYFVECGHHVPWNDPARAWLLAILHAIHD